MAREFAYLIGQPAYDELYTDATLLDIRVAALANLTQEQLEADNMVEILASQIAAIDYHQKAHDPVGQAEIRAVAGADTYLASSTARARAFAVAKDQSKLASYVRDNRQTRRRGRGREEPATEPRGDGQPAQRVECFRCGQIGHPARMCTAPAPVPKKQ